MARSFLGSSAKQPSLQDGTDDNSSSFSSDAESLLSLENAIFCTDDLSMAAHVCSLLIKSRSLQIDSLDCSHCQHILSYPEHLRSSLNSIVWH